MRFLVIFLSVMIVFLMGNVLLYLFVTPYKDFLREMKYGSSPTNIIDDSYNYEQALDLYAEDETRDEKDQGSEDVGTNIPTPDESDQKQEEIETLGVNSESLVFLETLSGERDTINLDKELPGITASQQHIIDKFDILLGKKIDTGGSLLGLTTEYPDPYHTWVSGDMTTHLFSTRSYDEVKQIFTVLEDELPYELNEVNNFGESSFYINLDEAYYDGYIRLIVQIQKNVFGLKIQKDSYNTVKTVLNDNF